MRKIILSLCLLLMLCSPAIAEYTGYTQYSSSNVDGSVIVNFGAELNISQINVNIDNNVPTGTLSDGTVVTKAKPITVPAAGIHQLNVVYDSDMQSDFDDIRFGYADGSLVPFNYYEKVDGDHIKLWVQTTNSNQLYLFYGSATATSGDDGEATFIEPDNPETKTSLNGLYNRCNTYYTSYYLAATQVFQPEYYGNLNLYHISFTHGSYGGDGYGSGYKVTYQIEGGSETTLLEGSTGYSNEDISESVNINSGTNKSLTIRYYIRRINFDPDVAYIHTCTATVDRNTYLTTGSEQVVGSQSFTVSATGDSETKTIGPDSSSSFSIAPTANISSFDITTASDDYDYLASVYWTEDTATINETVNNSHAVLNIDYTPADTITSGTLDVVFNTVDLSQYTGPITCTIDGSPTSATLTGNNVEITLSSLDTSTHDIIVSVPYNLAPALTSPGDGSSADYTFPPNLHDVILDWESTYADSYKYEVASDNAFNYLLKSGEITSTSTTVTLSVPDTYYWRVYANYDGTYSPSSDVYSFTMNADTSATTGTGVNGIVYDESENVIASASVNIYNDTWSESTLSTTDGYFLFTGLSNGTYFLQATKDGYSSSSIATATVTEGEIFTKNILLQKQDAPNYITPHYVRFIVTDTSYTRYSDATVTIYEGDSATALYTLTSGADGACGAELSETVEYRIVCEYGIQTVEFTLYPTDNLYRIYLDTSLLPDRDRLAIEEVQITITPSEINSTHANVYVNYVDNMSETTSLYLYVNNSDGGVLASGDIYPATSYNFTIPDYKGNDYNIIVKAEHGTFGSIVRQYSIHFNNTSLDIGIWGTWIAVVCILMVAMGSGKADADKAAGGILVLVFIFMAIGWLPHTLEFTTSYAVAFVVVVAWHMKNRDRSVAE